MKQLIGILMLSGLLGSIPIYGFTQNIALNKPVVTSSVSGSFTGNRAVDGSTFTRWSSAASDPQWIYVDLGSQYNITSVKITWSSAYGKNYSIDVSNNATAWTTIKSITNNTSLTNTNAVTGTGRYVRIYGTQRGTTSGYSIYELQVNGSLTSCGTPTGLTSSSITTTSATVRWTGVSGAVSYNLQWKASSSSTWTTVSGITTISRSLTGLTAGTAYQFQVQTVCSAGSGAYSAPTTFTTTASCGIPTGLSSSNITTTSATVAWTAVSGAVTYNLQWKLSSSSTWTTISGLTTTSRSLTGLTAGTAYQFQVQTVCSAGSSLFSTAASFTTVATCGIPTGLTSSSITTTSATVRWTAVSGAVTYNLQWKLSSSSTWTTISGLTTTSRSLTGLTAGTTYQFQVQTVCSSGSSSYSTATSFTTAAPCGIPTGLASSSITTASATVSWTAVPGAVTYNLQWKASSSSTWTTVSGITTTSSNLTGLTAGTAYQFQVQTVCSGGSGSSSYSTATSFTTAAPCGIPTGLASSSVTTTSATVSWTAVPGAVTYNLQWRPSSSSTWTTVSGITTTSRSLTGLTASTAYQFQVQTVCSGGSGSSLYSTATSFTTAAPCGIPTGLASSSITTTSATVSWTAVPGAATYNLQWKLSSSSTWTTISGITTTSRSLTGLTAGTAYQFQVQTVCSGGSGSGLYSSPTSFTTAASCGIPTGLTSSSITTNSATVSWSAVSGALTYNLQWKLSSSSTWTTVSGIATTSSDLAGLTAGTAYQFQIQTVCSGGSGSSSYSSPTSFTTAASCGIPTGLTSSSITTNSATVSWSAVSGAVTYNLQWKLSSSSTWTTVSGIATTSSDLTGLTAGTAYQFQVQTVCSGGSGSSSYGSPTSFTTAATCAIPTGLTSSSITTNSAIVSWSAVSGAVTYNLQWKLSSSSTWTTVSGITTTSSDLTGLTAGTAYQFQVQTVCSGGSGSSSYSTATSYTTAATCAIPTGLTSSTITTNSATVSWSAVSDAVTYNLQWKPSSSSTWTTVSGITTTSSDLTGLSVGTAYDFQVQTVCSGGSGSSSYSTATSFTTAASCGIPTGLNFSGITTTSATVSWAAIPGAVTYNLQWKTSSSSTWTTVSGITTTSSNLTGLTEGTAYQFQVQTVCSGGSGSSSYSSATSFTTAASCGIPTDLTSSSITTASATVSWTAIPGAVTYNLQWKTSSSSTWTTVSGITTTSSDLTGLTEGTTYQFQVQTVCSGGSGSSSYSTATSFATAVSCGTPTDLASSSITNTTATVNWNAIPGDVIYNLRWKASSSSTWTTVNGITTTSSDLTELTEGTTYQFMVQTVCSVGTSSYSDPASFATAVSCGTPTDLTSSNITNTSATVSWTAIPGAVTYDLQWKASSSSTWTTVSGITTNSSDLTELIEGTAYQFQVQTVCSAGSSSYSDAASFTTVISCGTPTDLTSSSITNTSATVSWTAIPGAVTYNLKWKPSSSFTWTTVNGITTTSIDLIELTEGTAYQFRVQTICSAGSSSYSDATSFTTVISCGIPTDLTSSNITNTSATVSWTPIPGAVSYDLQWKASSSSTWTTVNGITTTSSDLTGLAEGTAYQFQVQTVCSAGSSSYSDAASFTTVISCGTPTDLTSSNITNTSATVSWTVVSDAVSYNLQWKASSSSTWTTVSGITTTSSNLTELTEGTAYQFQVQTVCSAGSSSYSDAASFTTVISCGTPTDLTSSGITTTSATVSWTAIPGAVTYDLQWKVSSSSTWTTVNGITTTSSDLTELTAGTAYQFQVQAVCSAGSSTYSTAASFTTAISCVTPTDLTSSNITNTGATVSWTAIPGAVTYNLQWKASASSTWTTVSGITTTSSDLTGLTAGTAYQFQVQTVCPGGSGSSSYSAATSFTTAASCGIPTDLTSSGIINTSATVSWTAIPGAVTYNLQWKASSSPTWTTVSGITTTSSNLTGLTAATAYQFQVQTICSGGSGSSSYSDPASFATTASCGTTTDLTSSGITTTSATVSWTAIPGAVTYDLQWKVSSSSTWTTVNGITTASSSLTGLTAGTAYQFQVQTVCSTGSSSYSDPASFTTPGGITSATGKTYYFSSSAGDDSRTSTQAQNSSTPWKTLSKLNSFFSSLQAGDLVLFKRGDVFPGSITATTSGSSSAPIAFSAYGTGAKPIITGFTTLTSSAWTQTANGLYEATVSAGLSTLNMVTLDGAFQVMGKYPKGNSGYLTISSGSTSSISSSGLSGIPSFTSGEIVWRPYHWSMWRATVNSQSSSSVSFTAFPSTSGGPTEAPQSGYGFFFQNHPNACTSLGEWAYNSSSHKITMYFGGSGAGSHVVNVSSIENLVTLSGRSYIIFDNIALQGANARSFSLTNSNNIIINACDIFFSGQDAVNANSGCSNITVTNCNISYSNFNGIVASGSSAWNITGNTISNTAAVAGMGGTGEGQYFGIRDVKNGSTVALNKITNTGYIPICFQGTNNTIQNNLVDTFCTVKDDGGAIYCGGQNNAGTKIISNIIFNGIGAKTGTPDNDSRVHGIYADDASSNIEIAANTVAFCGGAGIYNHDSYALNIHDNTTFDNKTTGIKFYNNSNIITNNTITGNIFFAKTASQFVLNASGGSASPSSYFATSDNNYWCRPLNENGCFQTLVPSVGTYNLAGWRTFTGKEANSHTSPVIITDVNKIRFEYNSTTTSKTVNLGGSYVDAKGTSYASSITLAPFTSAVLISTSGTTAQSIANTTEIVDETNLSEKPSFVIYPNPVTDNFVLQLNNSQMGKMSVQIVNQSGAIIHSYQFNKDQVVNQVTVPANDLSAGVYFIHVQIGTWSDKGKIVKL